MTAVSASDLRAILRQVTPAVPEPTWDFVVYARFLAARLPEGGMMPAPDLARAAEDLVGELKVGIDRRSGATFDPPLVSGRSDLVYNHFRAKLAAVAMSVGGAEFAAAVTASLVPVVPAPKPKPESPKSESPKMEEPKAAEPKAVESKAEAAKSG
jgi:hypothetical protein